MQRQSTRMSDAIPVNKRVAASLWRLATGDCYRSCGLMIGGNRKEHSKAKTKNTHREPRKFAMLVTETSKRDAASAPISPKKKNAPSVRSRLCGFLLLTFAASRLVEQLSG